jgi:hypothetical protein
MGLTLPKLVPGWIYCIRDEDYLDGSMGRFVKIGLTSRTVDIRISEHQTGNPRKEISEYDIELELMNYAETYLHHYFSQDRIAGEWFDMDTTRVMSEVEPILQTFKTEMAAEKPNFNQWSALTTTLSNGVIDSPTSSETALHQLYLIAHENLTLAEAQHKIHDNNLRALVGISGGIEGVLKLNESIKNDTFRRTIFDTLVTPAQLAQCDETITKLKGSLSVTGGRKIDELDAVLNAQLIASASSITNPPNLSNLGRAETPLIQTIKNEHMAWLGTRRQVKVTEWECLKLKAQIVVALGPRQSITNIVTWRRYMDTKTTFNNKKAKELFEVDYNASFAPVPNGMSVIISDSRKYNP